MFRSNLLDPVDLNEQYNDRIEKIQGNRNPFIDDEKLVDKIEHFHF